MTSKRSAWRVQPLGSFVVAVDGVEVEADRWRLRRARALVAMLALSPGQRRHREQVLDRLRPDSATFTHDIGHLPTPLTSFVGREREIADVERLTAASRLLTRTGAGGSGRTRLAVEAARFVRAACPAGVWFVDLTAPGEQRAAITARNRTNCHGSE